MLNEKTVIVTSGGTQEYIDDVRVLTNISSGALGCIIAEHLLCSGVNVEYVHGKNTSIPDWKSWLLTELPVRSAQDAYNVLESRVPHAHALIHCMAVSDFTFKRDQAVKCKSSDPMAFIEYMRSTITLNPKIISKVKSWNPNIILVGFKFEVGITTEELIALAQTSISKNGCDLVVANDKKEMERNGEHTAHLVYSDAMLQRGMTSVVAHGKLDIAYKIRSFLKEVLV